jgi:hypothetical protein
MIKLKDLLNEKIDMTIANPDMWKQEKLWKQYNKAVEVAGKTVFVILKKDKKKHYLWKAATPNFIRATDLEGKKWFTIKPKDVYQVVQLPHSGYKVPKGFNEGKLSEKDSKGLWANIHAKRKRGEKPAKKGDKDYPKTLNIEGKLTEGTKNEYAQIYDMKKEMKEGKFDPKNPTINVVGLGVYNLKLLEKVIKRDLGKALNDLGYELGAKNLNYHLYKDRSPLQAKIKGLHEVYQQMNTSSYKRAVTMYKRKR